MKSVNHRDPGPLTSYLRFLKEQSRYSIFWANEWRKFQQGLDLECPNDCVKGLSLSDSFSEMP